MLIPEKRRAIVFVIDALGIGSMPDYKEFDEYEESNTLNSVTKYAAENLGGLKIAKLLKMGIANITPLEGLSAYESPTSRYGKMSEKNKAKDTITGHWEMMGVMAKNPFPYYPNGFPEEILERFKKETGVKGILGNIPASGTKIINDLGDEHLKTGFPIIYTSADSVLQIATHVDKVPLEKLYKWCEIAREIMRGEHEVARIIARPFKSNPDQSDISKKYIRLNDKRHDYSVLPHEKSDLERLLESGVDVLGIGKIQDIFAGVGVSNSIHSKDNQDGLRILLEVLEGKHAMNSKLKSDKQFIFINLVETDSNFGHRRDPEGYAKALEEIDLGLAKVLDLMTEDDLLLITADHGCDPCAAGSDHTREYVPILEYHHGIKAKALGTVDGFNYVGNQVKNWFFGSFSA